MNIGQAIEAMKNNKHVRRAGWNGKGMFLFLEDQYNRRGFLYEPCIVMYTAQGQYQPGWLASQSDLLATDWEVVG